MNRVNFNIALQDYNKESDLKDYLKSIGVEFRDRIRRASFYDLYESINEIVKLKEKEGDLSYFYMVADYVLITYLTNLNVEEASHNELEDCGIVEEVENVNGYTSFMSFLDSSILREDLKNVVGEFVNVLPNIDEINKVIDKTMSETNSMSSGLSREELSKIALKKRAVERKK